MADMGMSSLIMQGAGSLLSLGAGEDAASAATTNAQLRAQAAAYEAAQLRQRADQAMAESQVQGQLIDRQSMLLQGRALAVAGASGAGVSDPTVMRTIAGIAGEGTYRKAAALWGGSEQARLLQMQATAREYEGQTGIVSGDLEAEAARTKAAASALSGGSSLFANLYKGGGTKTGGASNVGGGLFGDFPTDTATV